SKRSWWRGLKPTSAHRNPLARALKIRVRCRKTTAYRGGRTMNLKLKSLAVSAVALAAVAAFAGPAAAQNKEPIKIGFSMSLTGGLAANGKQALLGAKIWEEDVNKAGGLLGRQVKLVYYDDQSTPSNVPSIYTKLLD